MRKEKGFFYNPDKQLYRYRFYHEKKEYSVYGKSKKECREKEAELREKLKNHMHLDNQKITLKRYYEGWRYEQEKKVKASSLYGYEKAWNYIEKPLGNYKVVDIHKEDVQQFQRDLHKTKTAETTNRALRLLKQILNAAVNDRIISFNPCTGVNFLKTEKPKAVNTTHRALTEEETQLFLDNAKRCHYYNLFRFLLATGCRVSEATALTWFDVDFRKEEIYIHKTVCRTSHNDFIVSDSPKTKSSERIIPMMNDVKAILQEQKENNLLLFGSGCPWIFPNNQGQLANYNGVDNSIRIIIGNINSPKEKGDQKQDQLTLNRIQPLSVHAFRDTFATRCIEQGMQPNTLKALLGHSSLKMTMDLYAHVMPNTKRQELEKIKFAI